MGPAYYILAILGCSDNKTACEQVRVEPTHYASADACSAATANALVASSDLFFPVVMARCRPANTAFADASPRR